MQTSTQNFSCSSSGCLNPVKFSVISLVNCGRVHGSGEFTAADARPTKPSSVPVSSPNWVMYYQKDFLV